MNLINKQVKYLIHHMEIKIDLSSIVKYNPVEL
jgi:hypothetical protein